MSSSQCQLTLGERRQHLLHVLGIEVDPQEFPNESKAFLTAALASVDGVSPFELIKRLSGDPSSETYATAMTKTANAVEDWIANHWLDRGTFWPDEAFDYPCLD